MCFQKHMTGSLGLLSRLVEARCRPVFLGLFPVFCCLLSEFFRLMILCILCIPFFRIFLPLLVLVGRRPLLLLFLYILDAILVCCWQEHMTMPIGRISLLWIPIFRILFYSCIFTMFPNSYFLYFCRGPQAAFYR